MGLFFEEVSREPAIADAIIRNQAFLNGRYHISFSLGLDKVETGYNLLME